MEQEHLTGIVESLLFVSAKPLTPKELAKFLETEVSAVEQALTALVELKKDGGVIVLENGGEYQMATQPKNSTQVKNFLNTELREKLTDATVEVLAIIAYRQPISKAEIEAIRGVNSQYSLRALLMRGLIEKVPNPHDARGFLYQTTTEVLMHLGLNSTKDLPEFEKLVAQIKLPETPALTQDAAAQDAVNEPGPAEVPAAAQSLPAEPVQIDEPTQALEVDKQPESAADTTLSPTEEKEEEFNEDDDEDEEDDEEE